MTLNEWISRKKRNGHPDRFDYNYAFLDEVSKREIRRKT